VVYREEKCHTISFCCVNGVNNEEVALHVGHIVDCIALQLCFLKRRRLSPQWLLQVVMEMILH